MVDRNKLKAKIIENGRTQADIAKEIGMSEGTFSRKMKSGKFGLDEAERLIVALDIRNPGEIFFAKSNL